MNLTEFFGRQNMGLLIATGVLLFAAVTVTDFATGQEFDSSIFYLVPVSFFAWFIGRPTGLVASAVAAALSLGVRRADSTYPHSIIGYWNTLAWLGAYIFFVLMIAELRSLYERERRSSRTDTLTMISNRRAFFESLNIEKSRAKRHSFPLTLAYIDINHFKQINDRFGHTTGDTLLTVVAKTVQNNLRPTDLVARLGGDEFAVLLAQTAEASAAAGLQKLQDLLEAAMQERNWPVTFSVGAVTFQPPPDSIHDMISKADQAMYAAKKSGRNRVMIRYPAA